jgi:hypothetical protein
LNPVIDLQLIEFNDRFNEVNSELLTHMAAFSPNNSFGAFKHESLMELAKAYPDDFSPGELDDLSSELHRYIDNVIADARFAQLGTISEHGKLMVDTKKTSCFSIGLSASQTCASSPYCNCISREIFFSNENYEDGPTKPDR